MKILRGFTPSSFSIDQHIPESLIVLISRERLAPWKKYWEAHIGLSFFFFFLAFFFIIAARRPDIMLNAQLWAEDGAIWLQAIYADGLISLLFPMNGYYQTISRAILGFALLFGMDNVAFVANICAISIRSLLALFLLTSRLSSIDIRYRIVAVMYFLMMPNIAEGYVNATNTHWYTALYIMSIILADDPKTRAWKVHDCIVAIIGGLSGPFIVFLAPALLVKRLAQHRGLIKAIKGINAFDIAFTICFSVQLFAILCTYMVTRSSAPLDASLPLLVDIIASRMIFGTFFSNAISVMLAQAHVLNWALCLIFVFALAICLARGGWKLRSTAVFTVLVFGFSIAKPMISSDLPQWPLLLGTTAGERYFYITNFAFFCFVLYLISKLGAAAHKTLFVFSLALIPLFIMNFRITALPDVGYHEGLARLRTARVGEIVTIRLNPGGLWILTLQKK